MPVKQSGKGTKKYGRNKVWCERYRRVGKREANKGRKARRELVKAKRKLLHWLSRKSKGLSIPSHSKEYWENMALKLVKVNLIPNSCVEILRINHII